MVLEYCSHLLLVVGLVGVVGVVSDLVELLLVDQRHALVVVCTTRTMLYNNNNKTSHNNQITPAPRNIRTTFDLICPHEVSEIYHMYHAPQQQNNGNKT